MHVSRAWMHVYNVLHNYGIALFITAWLEFLQVVHYVMSACASTVHIWRAVASMSQ